VSLEAIDAEYAALRSDLGDYLRSGGRLAVVKAPPGSGKTHTLVEVLSVLADAGMRIAVAAQTNSQADDICRRWATHHPEVHVARFSSSGLTAARDLPDSVLWVTDKSELPATPGVTVATTAKWSLTDLAAPYD
jgi:hypothetical protein